MSAELIDAVKPIKANMLEMANKVIQLLQILLTTW